MNTQILKINPEHPEQDKIKYAAQVLTKGGTVAFPTETVYGLGANALNEVAIKKIFDAKGRPSDNPLIVHVSDVLEARQLVKEIPQSAEKLMSAFWPGPLTIVMQKSDVVPYAITAGLNTVAIRVPSHPIAQQLIHQAGVPVAAPSANISGKPSPTIGQHVIDDLYGRVDVIIDGDYAEVGLESTVIDLTTERPILLRPGGITYAQLVDVLGVVEIDKGVVEQIEDNTVPRSPGMKYTHYSPKADVVVVEGEEAYVIQKINELSREKIKNGLTVGVLAMDHTAEYYKVEQVLTLGDENKPETVATNLFRQLRQFDELGVDIIFAQSIKEDGIGLAIRNRLYKAAGYNIIRV